MTDFDPTHTSRLLELMAERRPVSLRCDDGKLWSCIWGEGVEGHGLQPWAACLDAIVEEAILFPGKHE